MNKLRTVAAVLLALPLIVFGANYFIHFFPLPPGDGGSGDQLLQAMRGGGLMSMIAFSHVVAGLLLVIPRTRFVGGMLQVPMTIGILAFHITMMPQGAVMAVIMLLLNLASIAEPDRLHSLVRA